MRRRGRSSPLAGSGPRESGTPRGLRCHSLPGRTSEPTARALRFSERSARPAGRGTKYATETASVIAVSGNRRPGQGSHAKRRPEHRRGQRDGEDDVAHALGVVRQRERGQQDRGRHADERDERRNGQSPPPHVVHDEHAGADEQHDESQPVRRVHRRLEEAFRQPCRRPAPEPDCRARVREHSIGHVGPRSRSSGAAKNAMTPTSSATPPARRRPRTARTAPTADATANAPSPQSGEARKPVPSASDSSKRSTNDSLMRSSTGSRP